MRIMRFSSSREFWTKIADHGLDALRVGDAERAHDLLGEFSLVDQARRDRDLAAFACAPRAPRRGGWVPDAGRGGANACHVDPLVGDGRAVELAVPRLLYGQPGAWKDHGTVEKLDAPAVVRASGPPLDAPTHDPLALVIEARQRLERFERGRRQHVLVRVRGAYHELALRFHPDRTGESEASEFIGVQEAYRLLSDPDERLRYDRTQPRWATYSVRRHIHQFAPDVIVEPAGPHEIIEGMLDDFDLTSASFVHEALHPDLAASNDVHLDLVLSPDEAETEDSSHLRFRFDGVATRAGARPRCGQRLARSAAAKERSPGQSN